MFFWTAPQKKKKKKARAPEAKGANHNTGTTDLMRKTKKTEQEHCEGMCG